MEYLLLIIVGIVAGFINTMAGGGSLLTLPALIFLGLPTPVANATNRINIFIQGATGSYQFHKAGKLDIKEFLPITFFAIAGSVVGSIIAVNIRTELFDKILGIVLVSLLFIVLFHHTAGNKKRFQAPNYVIYPLYLLIGFYGGFIQVGVGFIFLFSFNLLRNTDLIKANAAKLFIITIYTLMVVIIFTINGKIEWLYGIVLAAGSSIGAVIGVKLALKKGEKLVKIILAIAVLASVLKLFGIVKLP